MGDSIPALGSRWFDDSGLAKANNESLHVLVRRHAFIFLHSRTFLNEELKNSVLRSRKSEEGRTDARGTRITFIGLCKFDYAKFLSQFIGLCKIAG